MNFFRQFFISPKTTGAIAPSSRGLSCLIADLAQLPQRKCVVELGPGTGVFTKEIVRRLPSETLFFCLEINSIFFEEARANCPDVLIYHASAKDIGKYLTEHKRDSCDCVISGLPWAAFEQTLQEELLNAVYDSLEEGGMFLTFAYLQGLFLPAGIKFKKLLKSRFSSVKTSRIIWRNLPPALVYYCHK